jgi:hypothetical protein
VGKEIYTIHTAQSENRDVTVKKAPNGYEHFGEVNGSQSFWVRVYLLLLRPTIIRIF